MESLKYTEIGSSKEFSLLTKDIIDTIDKQKELTFKSNQNIEALESKSKILGCKAKRISKDFLEIELDDKIILSSNKKIHLDNTIHCEGLFDHTLFTSIDFTNVDTSKVTDMSFMFFSSRAKSLNLSSFDTSSVIDMQSMFDNCRVENLNLSSFDTSKVENMSDMFYNCSAKHIDISSFRTNNVQNMQGMFNKCRAEYLDISKFDTSKVRNIAFFTFNCSSKIKYNKNFKY